MWLCSLPEVSPETWLAVRRRREGRSRSLADIMMSTGQIPTRYTPLYTTSQPPPLFSQNICSVLGNLTW